MMMNLSYSINYRKKKQRRKHLENILNQVELLMLLPKVPIYVSILLFILCWNQSIN